MSTTSNATPSIATMSARIQILGPKLKKIANRFGKDEMEKEDIFSEIVEAILLKCKPEYSDAMILTKAKWVGFDHINKAKVYSKYVGSEDDLPNDNSRVDDDENSREIDFEYIDLAQKSVEDVVTEKEIYADLADAISSLSPALQVIVSLLSKGYSPVEIAKKRGISKSAVSQNIKIISKSLVNLNFTINIG